MQSKWSPSTSRTDLVAEIHGHHDAQIIAARRRQRARKRRTVFMSIGVIVMFAGIGVASKFGYDFYRRARSLETARTHLAAGTSTDLEVAVTAIDSGLEIRPGDAESLALLALVRAHQAVQSEDTTKLREVLDQIADADEPEAILARGIAAAIESDLEGVQAALSEVAEPPSDPALARMHAWLTGTAALATGQELADFDKAIALLEKVVENDTWVPTHRWLIALYLRAGRLDDTLSHLQAARAKDPTDRGITIDEAIAHAVIARSEKGVRDVTQALIEEGLLTQRDRARARLAQAIVGLRREDEDKRKDALERLDEAWKGTPAWDLASRDLAIEAALVAGEHERAAKWIAALDVEGAAPVYKSWVALSKGEIGESLEQSAKLSQTHPRVAYVQALALTEQGRWQEADAWVKRALTAFPERLELRVAAARVQAHAEGGAADAEKILDEIAESYPRTPRVFTGLAQAQLAAAGENDPPASASKALRRALEIEARPAEAAYLLGTIVQKQAKTDPKKIGEATDMLARAGELDPKSTRYRATYGQWLATHGERARAEDVLRTLPEDTMPPADALVVLARVSIERALERGKPAAKDEIEAWLAKAAELGAPMVDVARERARLALASGDPAALPTAAASLANLFTRDPKDVDSRVLHAQILLAQGQVGPARDWLRDGISRTPGNLDGRLHFSSAAVEAADGNGRFAASIAYKGWKKILEEPRPPNELIDYARGTVDMWIAIDNKDVPRGVAKSLSVAAPHRAEAWALYARTQLLTKDTEGGCASAKKALELHADSADAHGARAECLIAQFQYAEARKELGIAIERSEIESEKNRYRRRLKIIK